MPSRVLVMRHALSLYNEVIRNTPTHIADLDLNLIDSPLSSNGRKDLKVLAENWEDLIENLEPQDNQNKGIKKKNTNKKCFFFMKIINKKTFKKLSTIVINVMSS